MNEEMKNEIMKAAEILGLSEEDAMSKFEDICSKNNLDASKEPLLARGLWRQYFSSARNILNRERTTTNNTNNSFYKDAFGFFVSLNDAVDIMALDRDRVVKEYNRDSDLTYSLGKVAIFAETADGKYEGRMMRDNEERVKVMDELPENNVVLDSGLFLVPLNTNDAAWNKKNYGKPTKASEWRRTGVFVGEVDGRMGAFAFSYKGESSLTFTPNTFEWVHFNAFFMNEDYTTIFGGKSRTMESLILNSDLAEEDEKRRVPFGSIQDIIMEYCTENYSPLVDLEQAHSNAAARPYKQRYVVTDGTVTSINMTPTANGNRIINIDDLTTEFNFDNDGFTATTCWIPSSLVVDFGIGSEVIVVGRTSQGTNDEGALKPVTINVSGIYVISARGGSPELIEHVESEETDWFFD